MCLVGYSRGYPRYSFLELHSLWHFWNIYLLFQSTMNFNFVETHVFTKKFKLGTSFNIYFSFVSLVAFLGLEISVWKFWLKIPLTLCTKLWGLVATPKLFSFFSYFAGMIILPKWTKWGGVPKKNTIFIFSESPYYWCFNPKTNQQKINAWRSLHGFNNGVLAPIYHEVICNYPA